MAASNVMQYVVKIDGDSPLFYQQLFSQSHGIVNNLPDSSFTASASFNGQHGPDNCRIGAKQKNGNSWAWCGKANGDFIDADLLNSYLITGIETQARGDTEQYTTEYSVQTSENGINWIDHGSFIGNIDKVSIVRNKLPKPTPARFVKLKISKYHSHPSLRWDILVNDMK